MDVLCRIRYMNQLMDPQPQPRRAGGQETKIQLNFRFLSRPFLSLQAFAQLAGLLQQRFPGVEITSGTYPIAFPKVRISGACSHNCFYPVLQNNGQRFSFARPRILTLSLSIRAHLLYLLLVYSLVAPEPSVPLSLSLSLSRRT